MGFEHLDRLLVREAAKESLLPNTLEGACKRWADQESSLDGTS